MRHVLVLFALAAPALIHAQFQPPTPEELKMTADSKAPGADAVYLNIEDVTDDERHFYNYHARIKVLQEKGKELATIRVPYVKGADKVTKIEGRTIHADGTVIPLTVKPDDLVDFKTKDLQIHAVVFNLPSVEVGSILEYSFRLSGDTFAPTWWIQQPYFVHKAHFSFHPNLSGSLEGLMFVTRIDSGEKVVKDKKGDWTLDIANVPPEPDEDWMPPLNTLRWRVEFYYTLFDSQKEFWDHRAKYWANWVSDFTNPTKELKKTASELVAPGDTDEQKARKIYAAVQKLDNTDFSRQKSDAERRKEKLKDIQNAEDIWQQRVGSANDIALLYASLARAAGLKVWPAFVVNRNRALFDKTYLSDSQFDDDIVIVELDGKEIYLGPGQKMCPFGTLHWKHTVASGFRLAEKTAVFATTPAVNYKSSTVHRVANLSIDGVDSLTGTVRFVLDGQQALYWRQLALENDDAEVKKQFNESMRTRLPEGVQADFDHFLALDDPSVNLIGIVNVSGNIGAATGKRFFLPGLFFESRVRHPFVTQDKRTIPIDVHYPELEQDEVTYHLPRAFSVESTPQDADDVWPGRARLKVHSSVEDGSVTILRTLAYNFTLLDPKEYSNLHDFYQKVAAADQQQLVLTRTPAAKGN
jgi:hypothetical protein